MHRQQEQGQVTWDTVRLFRGGMRKAKVELNVARDIKNSKGLYKCVSMKRVEAGVTQLADWTQWMRRLRQPFFPSPLSGGITGQGLKEQSPSHCKTKSSL